MDQTSWQLLEFAYANLDCFVGRFDPGDKSSIDLAAVNQN